MPGTHFQPCWAAEPPVIHQNPRSKAPLRPQTSRFRLSPAGGTSTLSFLLCCQGHALSLHAKPLVCEMFIVACCACVLQTRVTSDPRLSTVRLDGASSFIHGESVEERTRCTNLWQYMTCRLHLFVSLLTEGYCLCLCVGVGSRPLQPSKDPQHPNRHHIPWEFQRRMHSHMKQHVLAGQASAKPGPKQSPETSASLIAAVRQSMSALLISRLLPLVPLMQPLASESGASGSGPPQAKACSRSRCQSVKSDGHVARTLLQLSDSTLTPRRYVCSCTAASSVFREAAAPEVIAQTGCRSLR